MKPIKTFALILLSIAIIITGWLYMAVMGAEQTVLSPAYYNALLAETHIIIHVHEQLQEQMKDSMLEEIGKEHEEEGVNGSEDEPEEFVGMMVGAFGNAFHARWLEAQALRVIEDILALVKGEQANLEQVIEFQEGQERLQEFLAAELSKLPPESLEEINIAPDEVEAGVEMMLEDFDLPDRLQLSEIQEQIFPPEAEETISTIQTGRRYLLFLPLLFLAAFFGLNYLLVGLYLGMKWFGMAAFVSSATFFAGLRLIMPGFLEARAAELGQMNLEPGTIAAAAQITTGRMSTVPILFIGAGLALFALGVVLERGKKNTD